MTVALFLCSRQGLDATIDLRSYLLHVLDLLSSFSIQTDRVPPMF